MTKAEQRDLLKNRLRETSETERAVWSAAIREHLTALPAWQSALTVMLFAALRREPDLLPLFDVRGPRRMVFPSMEADRIVPREVAEAGALILSPGGIREPSAACPVVDPAEIDLILIPGLGFGKDGTRLGRGKGHYDRFLASLPLTTVRCGVCFSCQVSDSLPAEPHDVPVHVLLTEHGALHEF